MSNEEINSLNYIKESNSKVQDYFNKLYIEHLEQLQQKETELFELDIQLETLEKTKALYHYNVEERRNVFAPVSKDNEHSITTHSQQIDFQIKEANQTKERIQNEISKLNTDITFFKEYLDQLLQSDTYIHSFLQNKTESDIIQKRSILKEEDYKNHQLALSIDHHIRESLISNLNKIDMLKWMILSDQNRAKITIDELYKSLVSISSYIDSTLEHLHYNLSIDSISSYFDIFMNHIKEEHSEYMIRYSFDASECNLIKDDNEEETDDLFVFLEEEPISSNHTENTKEPTVSNILSIRLFDILKELFNNIFQHSSANEINCRITITNDAISIHLEDNGTGIPDQYLKLAHATSGLHRIHNAIYLLNGDIHISGNSNIGTTVTISIPLFCDNG